MLWHFRIDAIVLKRAVPGIVPFERRRKPTNSLEMNNCGTESIESTGYINRLNGSELFGFWIKWCRENVNIVQWLASMCDGLRFRIRHLSINLTTNWRFATQTGGRLIGRSIDRPFNRSTSISKQANWVVFVSKTLKMKLLTEMPQNELWLRVTWAAVTIVPMTQSTFVPKTAWRNGPKVAVFTWNFFSNSWNSIHFSPATPFRRTEEAREGLISVDWSLPPLKWRLFTKRMALTGPPNTDKHEIWKTTHK